MYSPNTRARTRIAYAAMVVVMTTPCVAWAGGGADRDLPDEYCPGQTLSVTITIDTPTGTLAVGIEDSPPTGWTDISSISDGGAYDSENHKVKWGPFFDPSFPASVSYEITPPEDASGAMCFSGTVSFDGINQDILGDECVIQSPDKPADLDGDCDVDLADYALFANCLAGPDVSEPPVGCDPDDFAQADLDDDNDVDLEDFAAFQAAFEG